MKEREIKFRVWEYRHQRTKGKGWQDSKFIWQMNYSPMLEGGETMCYGSSVDLNNALKNGGDEDDGIINPSIFMQYTGLKDKKGKEIYEGDIILEDQFVEWINKEDARFDQEYGCYGIQNGKYNLIAYSEDEDFEVIGNIYENRDLLK